MDTKPPEKIKFYYIKSNLFRIIHADGFYGGLTPHGQILMAPFNERIPIPQTSSYKVVGQKALGDEVTEDRTGKVGVVREVEAGILMSPTDAEQFHKWLGDQITIFKRIQAGVPPSSGKETKPV